LSLTVGELTAYLDVDDRGFNTKLDAGQKKFGAVGQAVTSTAAKMASGLAAAGIAVFVKSSIGAASDLNESLSKTQVVFGAAGDAMVDWSKQAAGSFGMSQQAALEASSTYGNLFTSMGLGKQPTLDMSKGLVELAADLASFNNIDPAEALEKLRAGIVGETEPLRVLGVNLSAATVQQEAYRLGLAKEGVELTAAQKAQASYSLIMQQTKTAQGDFARTSGGLANKQRILKASFSDLSANLGTSLLPVMTTLVGTVLKVFSVFNKLPGPVKTVVIAFTGLAVAGALIAPFASSIMSMVVAMKAWRAASLAAATAQKTSTVSLIAQKAAQIATMAAAKIATAAQWLWNAALTANPIGLIIVAVAAFVAILIIAYKRVGWFRAFVQGAFRVIGKVLGAVWKTAAAAIKWFWGWAGGFIKKAVAFWYSSMALNFKLIYGVVKWLWNTISTAVKAFWKWAGPFISGYLKNLYAGFKTVFTAISVVVKWLLAVIRVAFAAYKAYITTVWNAIKAVTTTVWNAIKTVVTTAVNAIRTVVKTVFGALAGVVRTAMTAVLGVVRSLASAAVNALRAAWSGLAAIAGKLWSGIKTAILKYLNFSAAMYTAGKNLVSGLWRGISSMASWIYGQVKGFASGIFNKIKEGFGKLWPFSPSQAGVDVGYFLGIGIEKGITQSLGAVRRGVGSLNAQMQFAGGTATIGGTVSARPVATSAPVAIEFSDCIFVDSTQAGVERLWQRAVAGGRSAETHRERMVTR